MLPCRPADPDCLAVQLERQAEAMREGGLVTYKQQLSFGLHILAMMAAFYALGHVAGMALTRSKVLVSAAAAFCWGGRQPQAAC